MTKTTLNILKKKNAIVDKSIAEVERMYETLKAKLEEYTRQGGLKVLDIAAARADAERILLESGAYEIARMDTKYQTIIDETVKQYGGLKFKSPAITAQELDAIKNADFANFVSLTENARNEIARTIFQVRSSGMDYKQAVEAISKATDRSLGQARTFVETAQSAFNNIANTKLAESAGITKFEYVGPYDTLTRPFCQEHIGEVRTLEEWDTLKNDQIEPVSVYAGGYNCRHQLIGVIDADDN